jgi:hypothetical protein
MKDVEYVMYATILPCNQRADFLQLNVFLDLRLLLGSDSHLFKVILRCAQALLGLQCLHKLEMEQLIIITNQMILLLKRNSDEAD